MMNFATTWMNVFCVIGLALFIVVTLVVAKQLEMITDTVDALCAPCRDPKISVTIRRLCSAHAQLCRCIDLINKSFALILLSLITYGFIAFVVGIYLVEAIFFAYSLALKLTLLSYILKNILNIFIICYVSDAIPKQVKKIFQILFQKINYKHSILI